MSAAFTQEATAQHVKNRDGRKLPDALTIAGETHDRRLPHSPDDDGHVNRTDTYAFLIVMWL